MPLKRNEKRIIIEGPDGAGKSTLITQLQDRFHFLHVVRNDLGPDQDLEHWWPQVLDTPPDGTIPLHDRFFYSELVYGPLLRGSIKAEPQTVQNVLWFLRLSSMIVYCRPGKYQIHAQPQMEGVIAHHSEIRALYDEVMDAEARFYPRDRFFIHDWTTEGSLSRLEAAVENYLALPNSDGSRDTAIITGGRG